MKYILKPIVYFLIFVFALLAFLPKENLYYFVADKVKQHKIELSQSYLKDNFLFFNIDNLNIFYDGIDLVNIKSFDFSMLLFYNDITLNNLQVQKSMSRFAPETIDQVRLNYSVIDPLNINIDGFFKEGSLKGKLDILKRVVNLELTVSKSFSKKYKNTLKYFKKEKSTNTQDRYSYEYKL